MALSTAMERAMAEWGYTQEELGEELGLSRQAISHYKTGRRRMPPDVAARLVEKLDDGFVAMEIAAAYTGGAWVRELDGEHVDLHRAAVHAKTQEELREALDAIQRVCVAAPPRAMSREQLRELGEALIQAIDAIVALAHYVAVICREYGFSWVELWRQHFRKLKARKYVR